MSFMCMAGVDARRDLEIIDTELILADLPDAAEKAGKSGQRGKSGDKKKTAYLALVQKINDSLEKGQKAIDLEADCGEKLEIQDLHLLTAKPFLYILNIPKRI